MNTGASGLHTSQIMLDTIGDNIANVNTTAFKSNRVDLEAQFALTLREAAGPGDVLGGVNPSQVGLGSTVGAIQRSFVQGSISPTGGQTDLAIDGAGFFLLEDSDGGRFFTRDGAFGLNVNTQLVSRDDLLVLGYIADEEGNIDTSSAPGAVVIPIGTLTQVRATTTAAMDGNLSAATSAATAGAVLNSNALTTASGAATTTTPLSDLVDSLGTELFADGDVVLVSGVNKGGFALPDAQFVVGDDGTTVEDFMTFLEGQLAIHTAAELGEDAGLTLDDDGRMVVASNFGDPNTLVISASSIVNTTKNIAPFSFATVSPAGGEGLTTSFIAYDSLGAEVEVRLRMVLQDKGELGTTWQFYAESADDTDRSNALGTGTISFDENGRFTGATGENVTVSREGTGAADLTFAVDYSAMTSLDDGSEVGLKDQDGLPFGTLVDFSIDEKGFINGAFSNANVEVLGQLALATFINPNGLELDRDNNYVLTENSGAPNITVAEEGGAGQIESGALELSNVDLAREFIGLINASTGFSASSRVITTADELLQELLLIAR